MVSRLLVKVGGFYFFDLSMNWSEKAQEIAEEILDEIEGGVVSSYTRDDVIAGLKKAAIEGMKFECDNWLC